MPYSAAHKSHAEIWVKLWRYPTISQGVGRNDDRGMKKGWSREQVAHRGSHGLSVSAPFVLRCLNSQDMAVTPCPPSSVGSRTVAPTVGSGGVSSAFALALSPAPMITFPAPATSNPACRFPAPGFPVARDKKGTIYLPLY